jgi:S1-C subfamily serine protease
MASAWHYGIDENRRHDHPGCGVPHRGCKRDARDKPRMVTPYTQVSVPDTVAWRSPPARIDGSIEGAALPAQDLFKKVSPSVYWVRSDPTGLSGSSRYGSAIAVSDHEAVTNRHIVAQPDARLTMGGSQPGEATEAELVAVDFDADRCVVKTRSLTLKPVNGIRRYDSLEVGEIVFAVGNPGNQFRDSGRGLLALMRQHAQTLHQSPAAA